MIDIENRNNPVHQFSRMVQIEITNKCRIGNCCYCSRFIRHMPSKWEITLEDYRHALKCYAGFSGGIGMIGGDPMLHSQFPELCAIALEEYPRSKFGLWTSISPVGHKYESIINETFSLVVLNEHKDLDCMHTCFTAASCDVVEDTALRNELIDTCWIGKNWSPTVTPLGGYFCEVGAGIGSLAGISGVPIVPDWWKDIPALEKQKEICQLCGGCVPMPRQCQSDKCERISPSFLQILEGVPKDYVLFTDTFSNKQLKEEADKWTPGLFKNDGSLGTPLGCTVDWTKYE